MKRLLFALLLVAGLAVSSRSTTLLSNDFSGAFPPNGWTKFEQNAATNGATSTAFTDGGYLYVSATCAYTGGPPVAGYSSWVALTGTAWENYNFSYTLVTWTAKTSPKSGSFRAIFNMKDGTHYDYFSYNKTTGVWSFLSSNGGTWGTIYGGSSARFMYGGESVKIERRTNSAELKINNVGYMAVSCTSGTQNNGRVGFTKNSGQTTSEWVQAVVDDLLVDDLTPSGTDTPTYTPTATPTATATHTPTTTPTTIPNYGPGVLYFNDFSGADPPEAWTKHNAAGGGSDFICSGGYGVLTATGGGGPTSGGADWSYNNGMAWVDYDVSFTVVTATASSGNIPTFGFYVNWQDTSNYQYFYVLPGVSTGMDSNDGAAGPYYYWVDTNHTTFDFIAAGETFLIQLRRNRVDIYRRGIWTFTGVATDVGQLANGTFGFSISVGGNQSGQVVIDNLQINEYPPPTPTVRRFQHRQRRWPKWLFLPKKGNVNG